MKSEPNSSFWDKKWVQLGYPLQFMLGLLFVGNINKMEADLVPSVLQTPSVISQYSNTPYSKSHVMQQISLVLCYEITILTTQDTVLILFQALWTKKKHTQNMS